jgi:hypothetical protein
VYRNGQAIAPALPGGVLAGGVRAEGEEVVPRRRCVGGGRVRRWLVILGVSFGLCFVVAVVACLVVYLSQRAGGFSARL